MSCAGRSFSKWLNRFYVQVASSLSRATILYGSLPGSIHCIINWKTVTISEFDRNFNSAKYWTWKILFILDSRWWKSRILLERAVEVAASGMTQSLLCASSEQPFQGSNSIWVAAWQYTLYHYNSKLWQSLHEFDRNFHSVKYWTWKILFILDSRWWKSRILLERAVEVAASGMTQSLLCASSEQPFHGYNSIWVAAWQYTLYH